MTWIPGEQHAVGDMEAGIKGPVVLGRDQETGLIAPLLGSEGTNNSERAPLSGVVGAFGLLAWISKIWNVIANTLPGTIQAVGTAVSTGVTTIQNALNAGVIVHPTHIGTNGDPFSVAVEEGYDPDNPIQYPLVLKAGTSQKQLMTSVESTVGLTNTQLRATPVPVSLTGVALDTTVAAVTTSLGTDGATPPVIAGTGVRGFLRAIYDQLVAGIGVTGTFWQATQPVSGTFFQATQPVSAASLPLPALAATSTKQSDGTQKTQVVDGSGNVQPAGDTTGRAIKVDASATTQPVSATALPLPTGAATSGNQTTAQTSLGNIDTGIGTDGATPPTIPGTGVRGWMRSSYDTLVLIKNIFPALLDMNSGNKSASTIRVVIATDQVQLTNKLLVTPDPAAYLKTALTASAPTATSVGVSTASAIATNTNRKGLTLVNTSVNTISLGFGASAVLLSGVTLGPGDSYTMDDYSFFTGAINAIASAASSNLAIQEFTT